MPSPDRQIPVHRQLYLLSCWKEHEGDPQSFHWRFKLETPGPAPRRLFTTLQEVVKAIETDLRNDELRR